MNVEEEKDVNVVNFIPKDDDIKNLTEAYVKGVITVERVYVTNKITEIILIQNRTRQSCNMLGSKLF